MNSLFSFFLRLFICFVAAKLVVQVVDLDARSYLLSLTVLLLANVYLLDYLVFRDRRAARKEARKRAAEQGGEEPPTPGGS